MKNLLLLICLLAGFTAHAQWVLPGNMYADSLNAPFYYGVASGDPLADKVIIWTHYTPANYNDPAVTLTWEMALDSNFTTLTTSGTVTTDSTTDWTVKVDAAGLTANTRYYYRFRDGQGNTSLIGRTLTAPVGDVSNLKFAVTSCTSVFSGYFNGYRRIAERSDLNLVIHLGDYIYDFIDEAEEVRVPDPYAVKPTNLNEWRERHRYYMHDPDLRLVRQMHPFMHMWDNHDIAGDRDITTQAFFEWTPSRVVNLQDQKRFYRTASYGDLVDIIMLDIMIWRDVDEVSPGEFSVLGTEQQTWFLDALQQSTAKWKIVGTQKMFSYWGVTGAFPSSFNQGTWDGFTAERELVLDVIEDNSIENVIVISGDSHLSVACDLSKDPTNGSVYDGNTGDGGLGVEFCPTSLTRGNFDELGLPNALLNILYDLSYQGNPHLLYNEFTEHGYGVLDIGEDSTTASIWWSDIFQIANTETLGKQLVVYNGVNHWKRDGQTYNPVSVNDLLGTNEPLVKLYPNPADNAINIDLTVPGNEVVSISIIEFHSYKRLSHLSTLSKNVQGQSVITLPISHLSAGMYLVFIQGDGWVKALPFSKL
jgi:alkaline phosphatase D